MLRRRCAWLRNCADRRARSRRCGPAWRHGQDIAVQASGRRLEPGAEAVLGPVFRSQQNDPGAANEQGAQVGVAALGDAPEDTPVDICRPRMSGKAARWKRAPCLTAMPRSKSRARIWLMTARTRRERTRYPDRILATVLLTRPLGWRTRERKPLIHTG